MGLDQYLTRESTDWGSYDRETRKSTYVTTIGGRPFLESYNDNDIITIIEPAMYWRKANQIHNWFVKEVQGGVDECQKTYVSLEDLQRLVDTCKEVLANRKKAADLLATQSGFFFGGTDYDKWYFEDLKRTVERLQYLLDFEKENAQEHIFVSYYYHASW